MALLLEMAPSVLSVEKILLVRVPLLHRHHCFILSWNLKDSKNKIFFLCIIGIMYEQIINFVIFFSFVAPSRKTKFKFTAEPIQVRKKRIYECEYRKQSRGELLLSDQRSMQFDFLRFHLSIYSFINIHLVKLSCLITKFLEHDRMKMFTL